MRSRQYRVDSDGRAQEASSPAGLQQNEAPGGDKKRARRSVGIGEEAPIEHLRREIERLTGELAEERKLRAETERRLKAAEGEIELNNIQIEDAFGRANQAALKAEIASIELNQIFNTSVDAMWVVDQDYGILKINETFLRLLGCSRSQTVGKKCFSVFPGPDCRTPRCPLVRLSQGETIQNFDRPYSPEAGETKSFLVTATPYIGLDGRPFGIVEAYRDITARKRAEEALRLLNEELQRMASMDGLTRIANRRRFDECLLSEWKRMAREQKPLSLVLCDLDFFKLYNDTYGHQLGDDCLRAVAQCLSSQLKRPSDLAARYGGEEFVALLPGTDEAGAVQVAETIRSAVEGLQLEHHRSSVSPHVTLSLGVATMFPRQAASVESLVSAADHALYEAKERGRNRVVSRPL